MQPTSSDKDFRLLVGIFLTVWVGLILTPLVSYYLYLYYQCRRHPVIQKRYSNLVFGINLVAIVYLGIQKIINIQILIFQTIPSSEGEIKPIVVIEVFLSHACMLGTAYLYALRSYLICYDMHYISKSTLQEWAVKIDPEAYKGSWYLTHKKTYGNVRYLSRFIVPLFLISLVATVALELTLWRKHRYELSFYAIPVFSVAYFYMRRPKVIDHFKVVDELRLSTYCGAITLFAFVGASIGLPDGFFRYTVYIFLGSTCVAVVALLSTYWVLRTTRNLRVFSKLKGILMRAPTEIGMTIPSNTEDVETSQERRPEKTITQNLTLEKVVATKIGFNLFMQHLHFEFSMENLLAVTEMVQLQQYYSFDRIRVVSSPQPTSPTGTMLDTFHTMNGQGAQDQQIQPRGSELTMSAYPHTPRGPADESRATILHEPIVLPADIPQSSIVYSPKYTLLDKLRMLSDKYIAHGSELQLNIPSRLRNKILTFINITEEQMKNDETLREKALFLYDPVIEEVVGVMTDSYWRFQKTKAYQHLQQELQNI